MPPYEDEEGAADTAVGRVTFRVTHDSYGNPVVPRGTPLVLADGTVVGITDQDHTVPRGPRNVSVGVPRWNEANDFEARTSALRIGTVGYMATMASYATMAVGSFFESTWAEPGIPPIPPDPHGDRVPIPVPETVPQETPKSAIERLLDDEELV